MMYCQQKYINQFESNKKSLNSQRVQVWKAEEVQVCQLHFLSGCCC